MITKKVIAALAVTLITAGVFAAQSVRAEGSVAAGKELGYTCLGCHGIDGYRNAYPSYRVPKLGGQKAAYLIQAIKGYRDGTRKHPTMEAQATSLSDQEIDDVAAYLASLADDTVAAAGSAKTKPTVAKLDAAETCVACHGPSGISVNAIWPTLAGQHEDYLTHTLNKYRDGSRSDPLMTAQAALIDAEDVEVLARYFARLAGLETTKVD